MQALTVYDLILLQSYFANKKEPNDREKAAPRASTRKFWQRPKACSASAPFRAPSPVRH